MLQSRFSTAKQHTFMNKNFSYIHIEKLKEWDRGKLGIRQYRQKRYQRFWGVQGCWEHDMRLIETANAEKEKFTKNQIVCSETEWKKEFLTDDTIIKTGCKSPDFITRKAQELLKWRDIKPRNDQVKIAMLLQMVSPEFLRDGNALGTMNSEKVEKWKEATLQYMTEKFGDCLLAIMFHDDETNPHATAYVVPLIKKEVRQRGRKKKMEKAVPKKTSKKWCLSCADLFTPDPYTLEKEANGKVKKTIIGKGTCSLMQDEYAEALQQAGLKIRRGVRRAPFQRGLENETNRARYERLSAPPADIENLSEQELRLWAIDAAIQAAESHRTRIERDHYQIAAADSQKMLADSQRNLPVETVIAALTGMDPRAYSGEKKDRIQLEFLLPTGQRIGILKGNYFQNLTPDIPFAGGNGKRQTGHGGIDAVRYITNWNHQGALEWFTDNFGKVALKNAVMEKAEYQVESSTENPERKIRKNNAQKTIDELAVPDASRWPELLQEIVNKFHLPLMTVEKCHQSGFLFSNKFGHMIFSTECFDKKINVIPAGTLIFHPDYPEIPLKEVGKIGIFSSSRDTRQRSIFCSHPLDTLVFLADPRRQKDNIIFVGQNPENFLRSFIKKRCVPNSLLVDNHSAAGVCLKSLLEDISKTTEILTPPKGFNSWFAYQSSKIKGLNEMGNI